MLDLLSFDLFLIFRKIDLMLANFFMSLHQRGGEHIIFIADCVGVCACISIMLTVCKISNERICCLHQKDNILKNIFVYVLLTLT